MAKFYQHLDRGDYLGKVTLLDHIDDISDDDLILYKFTDGTICSKEFIASPDNINAFNGKYVMVELFSPTAQWTIEQKEISLGEIKTYTNPETGETFEIAPPGIQANGEYGGDNAKAKPGSIRVTATPPAFFGKKQVETDDNYVLSLHPELINKHANISQHNTTPVQSNNNVSTTKTINEQSDNIEKSEGELILSHDNKSSYLTFDDSHNINIKSPNVYITYNSCINTIDSFKITNKDGKEYTFTPDEFFNIIDKSQEPVCTTTVNNEKLTPSEARNKDIATIENYLNSEDVLITNLIEKSKKMESEIGMDIKLSLPPKEVYNTVKEVYPENMNEDFIKSLAYRIPIQSLINAIAGGLYVYYDGSEKNEVIEN